MNGTGTILEHKRMIKQQEDMERFTHMSPEDTFGTTLKVCCCIKISGLKKGKNYWASIDASLFLFFFFFPTCINIYSHFEFAYVSENSSKRRPKRSLHRKRHCEKGKQGLWTILILPPQQPLNKQFQSCLKKKNSLTYASHRLPWLLDIVLENLCKNRIYFLYRLLG